MEKMGNSSDVIWYGNTPGSTISRLQMLSSFEQILEVRDFGGLVGLSICKTSSAGIITLLIDGSSLVADIALFCFKAPQGIDSLKTIKLIKLAQFLFL